ncbi:phasin family protein [Aurantimonas sp. Leaf443]|uniref:phasin family protein n=1 Tax=Aurantimonas sp. Leaf443 TaxID=1736378 RepID=UPI0006F3B931|nr:phasin family protein [Aurantimonas sp. Leaf443]KQT83530.1 hypothetical protein ASG48_13380 [Aurantimonas sp. Leaf443]
MYEDANKVTKEAADNALKSFSVVTKGFQQIAAESGEFAKRSFEQQSQMFEKLTQARSVEKVIEVQNEYARSAYQAWVAQATKMGEIYADIARQAYKPYEKIAGKAMEAGNDAMKHAVAEVEQQAA